jgi:hypothetical protein
MSYEEKPRTRKEEQPRMLGPVMERFAHELFGPLITRIFKTAFRRGNDRLLGETEEGEGENVNDG